MKTFYDLILFLKVILKNIWRNRRRSLLTIGSVCIGTIALSMLSGYVKTMEIGLKDQAISKEYGHLQIARKGYFDADDNSFDYMMSEEEFLLLEDALYDMDEVDIVNKRLHMVGIIGNFENSTIFSGICGQTDTEIFMLPDIVEGFPLSIADPNGIVIGQNMAQRLGVELGSELLLFFTSETGSQEAIFVTLKGLYKGVMAEQEKIMIYIPLEAAWDLMLEKKIHRLLVFLNDTEAIEPVKAELETIIQQSGLDMEIKTWSELAVYFEQIINLFRGLILFGGTIILFVIIFGISNTMYMTISERTREIGTLRAIGKTRKNIVAMFFGEGLVMGILGALLGIALTFALIPLINSMNILLPPGPGQSEPIPVNITPDVPVMIVIAVVDLFIAAVASIFPSISIARKKIVDSLRQF